MQSETIFDKPGTYDRRTDRRPHHRQFLGNYGWRKIDRFEIGLIWITRRSDIHKRIQVQLKLGFGFDFFFRPPPIARIRPAAGSLGRPSSSFAARSIVLAEHPNTPAIQVIPPYPSSLACSTANRRPYFLRQCLVITPHPGFILWIDLSLKCECHPWPPAND